MATTQLADIYEPLPFNAAVDQAADELNVFVSSGILAGDSQIDGMASVGGKTGELPYFNPLSVANEPNYTSDDPATDSVPEKISGSKLIYRKAMMNNSWSTMDLARELALKDPLGAIITKIGQYWATQIQKRVVQGCMGVLADNVANDSGDMVYDIATDSASAITDAERISADAVLQAKQTMGDHAGALSAIAMHSVLYTNLQGQNLITFIPNARGEVNIPTYLGYRVVVDDELPAVSGTNRITYTSILFAAGAIAYGRGAPPVPSELERKPAAGTGGGQDVIHSRRTDIIHPYGFQSTGTPSADSQTLAELAAAAAWDRMWTRKQVGIAFLQTNG